MTVLEHLTELRKRLVISVLAITIGGIVVFIFSDNLINWLKDPYCDAIEATDCKLIYTNVLDGFVTRLAVAGYGGFVVAFPVVITQVWRFVSPGLQPKERKYAIPFILSVDRAVRPRGGGGAGDAAQGARVPARHRR